MPLFGWFRKSKKSKSRDVSDDSLQLAEDALASSLAKKNPTECVLSDRPEQRKQTSMTLVQGASDSKPRRRSATVNHEPRLTTSVKSNSQVRHAREEFPSVQFQHKAPSQALGNSLYPSLDLKSVEQIVSNVNEKAPTVKPEKQSIHDIAGEIPCSIEPRIMEASKKENKFDLLKQNAQSSVQLIVDTLKRSSKFDYDFKREFDVRENYSHIEDYETLRTFDDVKKCHQMANEYESGCKVVNDSKADPLFQGYYQKFRCYKGRKSDLIDCD